MRTDPRADEVRSIVERVFSVYLRGRKRREPLSRALSLVGRDSRAGLRRGGMPEGAKGLPKFPRLYEPEEEDSGLVSPRIEESILIDQGRYVARSYRTEGHLAMWLVAVGIVQFYDDRGRMLTTINLFESLRPKAIAA